MSHIISLNVAKFQQPLLVTLGVADEKPEGRGAKSPPPSDIGLSYHLIAVSSKNYVLGPLIRVMCQISW